MELRLSEDIPRSSIPYLYFFPDWDDFIYQPFKSDTESYIKGKRTYAHEMCGKRIPFDGLLSLSHIFIGKGALHRHFDDNKGRVDVRRALRIPRHIALFGDCGAFSYANESEPPFTPAQAAEHYHKFHFDIGASVDHIPLPEITVTQPDGSQKKKALSGFGAQPENAFDTRQRRGVPQGVSTQEV